MSDRAAIHSHAVVIGGSMAGLLAARTLGDFVSRVTIIERDSLPADPRQRCGAPQARHGHVLLMRGKQILADFFPGLERQLLAGGAQQLDWTGDLRLLSEAGWTPRFPSGMTSWSCSRDLLEWGIRRQIAALPAVHTIDTCDVIGLEVSGDRPRIQGCRLRHRSCGTVETVRADLVVDASGGTSAVTQWLTQLGLASPAESTVDSSLGFATRYYLRNSEVPGRWRAMKIQPCPPAHRRGGMMIPVEGNRWLVTLGGVCGDYPPTDDAGFLEFSRSLRSTELYEELRRLEPLTPAMPYRMAGNRLRHFEDLPSPVGGLVVLGDALALLNPLYGQGMTTAALAATVLRACLRQQSAGRTDWTRFSLRCQKQLARIMTVPWLLAAGSDLRWPGTHRAELPWGSRLFRRYFESVMQVAMQRHSVYRSLVEFVHILQPPHKLLRPDIVSSVVSQKIYGAWRDAFATTVE